MTALPKEQSIRAEVRYRGPGGAGRKIHLLILASHAAVRESIRLAVKSQWEGAEVHQASSLLEAKSFYSRHRISVLIWLPEVVRPGTVFTLWAMQMAMRQLRIVLLVDALPPALEKEIHRHGEVQVVPIDITIEDLSRRIRHFTGQGGHERTATELAHL